MQKPALFRNRRESVGYVGFNRVRNMFPYAFHDDKKEKGLFDLRPELEEFKKFGKRMVRDSDKNNKENKGTNVRPCNSNYKTKKGETYGLY